MATQITKLVWYHNLHTLIVNPSLEHCFRYWYSSTYRQILPFHVPFYVLRLDSYLIDQYVQAKGLSYSVWHAIVQETTYALHPINWHNVYIASVTATAGTRLNPCFFPTLRHHTSLKNSFTDILLRWCSISSLHFRALTKILLCCHELYGPF